jgi:hypothetical protein
LRANFLRGPDIVSNRRFKFFIGGYVKDKGNCYFDLLPKDNFLPASWGERGEKWRYAPAVEKVLKEIKMGRNIETKRYDKISKERDYQRKNSI